MPQKKANEAQYFFFCGEHKDETFAVMDFYGIDTISKPYHFTITALSHKIDLQPDDVVNKKASVHIFRNGEFCTYSGIVSEFKFVDKNVDFITYRIRLVPQLWLLSLNVQTRIFQKKNVIDVIKQVFRDAGFSDSYCTYDVNAGNYPQQEFVVQYQESDLNFISRLMEENGIWYYFKEPSLLAQELDTGSIETMVISDKPSSFAFIEGEKDIVYRPLSGLQEDKPDEKNEYIHSISYSKQVIPREVLLKNYNYRTPEVPLSNSKPIKDGAFGRIYEYGGHFKDTDQAQKQTELVANRIRSNQIVVSGAGNCRAFRAGHRFTLYNHERADLNTTYLLLEVVHQAYQTGDLRGTYINKFRCLPPILADNFRPQISAFTPKITGIMTAFVEADGSNYAALDDMGRYKVRMPFDLSNTKNYEGSKYIRLSQPYSGANYGIHFPSHEGAEMVYACIDGDPNKPVGLGMVPNANTISPVRSANKHEGIIRTAGGNELVMDDTDGKQKVKISTNAKHKLELDDERKRIVAKSTNGNKIVIDDRNCSIVVNAGKNVMKFSYANGEESITISTAGGHIITIDDTNKILQIQTSGGNKVELDDNDNKITLEDGNSKNTVTLDGGGGLELKSDGEIKIAAKGNLKIDAANIQISAKNGIEAKATADVKLKGMNIEAKANMNAKIEGAMNLEVKGGLAAKFNGGMNTELSGGALTKVTGAIVMIN